MGIIVSKVDLFKSQMQRTLLLAEANCPHCVSVAAQDNGDGNRVESVLGSAYRPVLPIKVSMDYYLKPAEAGCQ